MNRSKADERDDFNMFLKDTVIHGQMQPKEQYYCSKIPTLIGFLSILYIMTRVDKKTSCKGYVITSNGYKNDALSGWMNN